MAQRSLKFRLCARAATLLLWLVAAQAVAQTRSAQPTEDARAGGDASAETEEQPDEKHDNGLSGVPIVAFLPEAGFILGGYAVYHFRFPGQPATEPTSTIPLLAAVTTKKELGIDFTPELFLPGKAYWLIMDLSARLVPDQTFFGLGNDTRPEDEETYRDVLLGLDTDWRRQVIGGLYLGVAQTLEWRSVNDVDPDGLLATTRPPGIDGGFTAGIGPEVAYDTRDNTFAPLRGSFVLLAMPIHGPSLGSEWSFARVTLDARHYLSLHGPHVLAFHLMLDAILGTAPFDRLPEIAGPIAMRGYLRGRFRDERALSFEIEYRFPIYWRFGGAAFVGIGQVAEHTSDLTLDRFHVAGGLGIRFALVPEERINLRLDVAATPDAVHPYFAPGEFY